VRARLVTVPSVFRVLLVALLASPALLGAEPETDPRLLQSLRQIETAFRAADAGRLAAVLPGGSKVLVGLESFSQPKAYYAPDQVILIFRKIFRRVRVIRFRLEHEDAGPPKSEVIYVPALWSVRRESNGMKDIRLQFTIRREGDAYYIRGIKEVH
jgi:hypothetical protein